MAATTASVCGYDTHVQNSTSTPGNLSVVPTHGQLLLLLLLSLSFHYLLSPFWWLEKDVGGGPKGISLAKYVSTCLHIPDLYVEYSRPAVSLDSEISLSLSLRGCFSLPSLEGTNFTPPSLRLPPRILGHGLPKFRLDFEATSLPFAVYFHLFKGLEPRSIYRDSNVFLNVRKIGLRNGGGGQRRERKRR